jgi:hypothetical protein
MENAQFLLILTETAIYIVSYILPLQTVLLSRVFPAAFDGPAGIIIGSIAGYTLFGRMVGLCRGILADRAKEWGAFTAVNT